MFGRLPSYGFYCRHVNGLRMRNVEFGAAAGESRPVLLCEDVKNLEVDGLRSAPVASQQPAVKLVNTKRAFLSRCVAPEGTKTFLSADAASERVTLIASDLGGGKHEN
jgi:hypothetical protein